MLTFLSVDVIIDLYGNVNTQKAYYCTLMSSFTSILGILRLLIPCGILTIGILASKKLILIVTALTGLPILLRNLMIVHDACQGQEEKKEWIGEELKRNHVYMGILFIVLLGLLYYDPRLNTLVLEGNKRKR
jgi:hypothetical protein